MSYIINAIQASRTENGWMTVQVDVTCQSCGRARTLSRMGKWRSLDAAHVAVMRATHACECQPGSRTMAGAVLEWMFGRNARPVEAKGQSE